MTIRQKLLVVAVLLLGIFLRLHHYDLYPQRGATSDEYTYSFLGLSLLTKGLPISWSYFGAYNNRQDLTIDRLYFPIVWPYFDHPPLNGLLVASWAIINGQRTFESVRLQTIRLVPIFLTTISSVLLFLLSKRLYSVRVAFLALLIYSTATIMVVSSRVVLAENLLTPIFLGALLYYVSVKNKMNGKQAILLGILSVLAVWTKEVGIVVAITILSLGIYDRVRWRKLLIIALVTILGISGYIGYGFFYDKDVFLAIITTQASRLIGPETFWMLTSTPVLINKIYYDGWYLFGLLSLFILFTDIRKNYYLLMPFLLYFLLLLATLTSQGEMGWYMIPLYPFMAMASARILSHVWEKPSWSLLLMILVVAMPLVHYGIEIPFGLTQGRFRLFLGISFLPYLLLFLFRYPSIIRLQRLSILLFLFLTGLATYLYIHPA